MYGTYGIFISSPNMWQGVVVRSACPSVRLSVCLLVLTGWKVLFFYTFTELISMRLAKRLVEEGFPPQMAL